MKIFLPSELKEINNIFRQSGYSCFLVGGAVRNMARNVEPQDYDLATNAKPETVINLFSHVIPTGIKHGTVTILYKKKSYEVTTFRVDGKYSNSRHPDNVLYTADIYEDLKRRDFTMNAMALDLETKSLIDPHDGLSDIQNKIIRAIGCPEDRFLEDGLRLMRACRFAAQLEYEIEAQTQEALLKKRDAILNISAERIRDELIKILESEKPEKAFQYLKDSRILHIIIPELTKCISLQQKGSHIHDVYTHSIMACSGAVNNLTIRLAALLHDIGKAETISYDELGIPCFHTHELVSQSLSQKILQRLRFPKNLEWEVSHLIEHHMFHYEDCWSDAAVRRFIAKVGVDYISKLFALRRADYYGKTGLYEADSNLKDFQRRIDAVLNENAALSRKDLAVNGHTLHIEAGIPKSHTMGAILDELLETVLDDPEQNEKGQLVQIAKNIYKKIKIIE